VNEEADNWDEFLQPVAFSYRVNVQSTTKFSPFELMYGVTARLPIDLEGKGDVDPSDANITDDAVVALAASLKATREQAKTNIKKSQVDQKRRIDIKHEGPVYKIGDKVMKCRGGKNTLLGDKVAPLYTGPFTVVAELRRGVYKLIDGDKPLKQVVNAVNLKLWGEDNSDSSLFESPDPTTSVPVAKKRKISSGESLGSVVVISPD